MRVGDVFLNGIGVYVPETRSAQSFVDQGLLSAEKAKSIGMASVAVADAMPAPEMALRAAQDALKISGLSTDNFGLLVYADVWHQGPEGWEPQYYLQHYLLGDHLLAVEIKHGCSGMFTGMELAVGMLRADDQHRAALIVASDNFGTPLIDRWAPGAGFTVLGDAASAVVLARDPGFAQLLSICTVTYPEMEEAAREGEQMFPPSVTVGRVSDFAGRFLAFKQKMDAAGNGWEMSATHIQRNIECVKHVLAEAEIMPSDIKWVLTTNMSRDEAEAYLGVLGFPLNRSPWDFGSGIGHTGASDQVLSLHHLLSTQQLNPGDHLLLCGFSPGMTYKAAVVKILTTPSLASTGQP